ncbi:MAG: hypothetical protein KTR25_19930 [Myxococcales bacterium]|nr:hypothetical protein [Myxococcales bacterium]
MRHLIVAALAAYLVTVEPASAEARRVFGAILPDPLDPINEIEGRFSVPRPFKRVLKDLRRTYSSIPGIIIRRITTSPQVRAYYVENTRRGRSWDGINLYEDLGSKRVYLTVLRVEPKPQPRRKE